VDLLHVTESVAPGLSDLSVGLLAAAGFVTLHVPDPTATRRGSPSPLGYWPSNSRRRSRCEVSVSATLVCGFGPIVGTLSGVLGVDGGSPDARDDVRHRRPVAVGADILQSALADAFDAVLYAQGGPVEPSVVATLLLGSTLIARTASAPPRSTTYWLLHGDAGRRGSRPLGGPSAPDRPRQLGVDGSSLDLDSGVNCRKIVRSLHKSFNSLVLTIGRYP